MILKADGKIELDLDKAKATKDSPDGIPIEGTEHLTIGLEFVATSPAQHRVLLRLLKRGEAHYHFDFDPHSSTTPEEDDRYDKLFPNRDLLTGDDKAFAQDYENRNHDFMKATLVIAL